MTTTQDVVPIRRALISMYNKSGLEEFLKRLDPKKRGIEIISSGGTAKEIRRLGYDAMDVSQYTGYPESPGGLVKTLHPKVHGGILLDPQDKEQAGYINQQDIGLIDLVAVNLYPFSDEVQKFMTPSTTPPKTYDDVREQIDIGGPAMVRAAAKNFRRVAILVNWSDAGRISTSGAEATTTLEDRFELMKHAFEHTAEYDGTIVNFWSALISPKRVRDFYLGGK